MPCSKSKSTSRALLLFPSGLTTGLITLSGAGPGAGAAARGGAGPSSSEEEMLSKSKLSWLVGRGIVVTMTLGRNCLIRNKFNSKMNNTPYTWPTAIPVLSP